jgi:predicted short-subunit dehydrogenase-like oxidoreductase (DUF2520 family)
LITVFFIGSGRLAQNLANAFTKIDIQMVGVWSRDSLHANAFGYQFNIPVVDDLACIPPDCDLYIYAVSDNAVEEVSKKVSVKGICIHCSGMLGIDSIKFEGEFGAFWPIQTLSKDYYVSFENVPICIESKSKKAQNLLMNLATLISAKPILVSEKQRQQLHLSAVMVNNFTNHLYILTKDYLEEHGQSFEFLKPLINETTDKILKIDPKNAQTGPAIRKDFSTIHSHQLLLENNPELLLIYNALTNSILNQNKS